jgi:hypothetical protein
MKELNVFCFITNLVVAVVCGGIMLIIPSLTRKSFLFGVKIPPEEQGSSEAIRMRKRYIAVCVSGSVVILALSVAQFVVAPDGRSNESHRILV